MKKLLEFFKGFQLMKGLGKVVGGAIAAWLALTIQNPSQILSLIPEKWLTMTLAGVVYEILDYLYFKLKPVAK